MSIDGDRYVVLCAGSLLLALIKQHVECDIIYVVYNIML